MGVGLGTNRGVAANRPGGQTLRHCEWSENRICSLSPLHSRSFPLNVTHGFSAFHCRSYTRAHTLRLRTYTRKKDFKLTTCQYHYLVPVGYAAPFFSSSDTLAQQSSLYSTHSLDGIVQSPTRRSSNERPPFDPADSSQATLCSPPRNLDLRHPPKIQTLNHPASKPTALKLHPIETVSVTFCRDLLAFCIMEIFTNITRPILMIIVAQHGLHVRAARKLPVSP